MQLNLMQELDKSIIKSIKLPFRYDIAFKANFTNYVFTLFLCQEFRF